MKAIVVILFISFLQNCSTFIPEGRKNVSYDSPDPRFGCAKLEGDKRAKCISKLISELEDIKNSRVRLRKISSERIDSEYVRYKNEYCLVSDDTFSKELYCFEENSEEYNPTALGTIKRNLILSGAGFLFGMFFGLYGI